MPYLPVERHLIDLLRRMEQEGFHLTIAGGLGIYLKHDFIRQSGRDTFLQVIPDARATEDIDSFLAMDIFLSGSQDRVRKALSELGYDVFEKGRYFQFIKADDRLESRQVKVDLHARPPTAGENETGQIKVQGIRLGRQGHTAFRALNAYETPEAFAIDDGVQELPLSGLDSVGASFTGVIRIPHPFASLCMKLRAAQDFEHTPPAQRDGQKRKHAFDVYLLTAMLTQDEYSEVKSYAQHFGQHSMMPEIRDAVATLFHEPDAPGCRTARGQLDNTPPSDISSFCAALRELFAG